MAGVAGFAFWGCGLPLLSLLPRFGNIGAASFMIRAKGTGTVEIRLNSKTAKPAATIEFSSTAFENHVIDLNPTQFRNVKTVYFVFTAATNVQFDAWQFTEVDPDAISPIVAPSSSADTKIYDLSGRRVSTSHPLPQGINIIDGKKVMRRR